jgi:Na+-driven multidrug efflux pump
MRSLGALCIRLQCLALPIHGWVAVVNMLCSGLGNAVGASLLATARQGTCMLPILFPMAHLWGAYGICSVQAVADVLSLALAIPISLKMLKKIKNAQLQYIESQ